MGNISDEINIIDAEIKKTEKAILKEVEDYKEVKRENLNHFKQYNNIPLDPLGACKETKKILVDAMRNDSKELQTHKHTMKDLQSRLDTLKQSRENKLNKIVFREDLEEVDKLQKEAEELKQRRAELSAKYAKPNPQDTPVSTPQDTAKQDKFIPFQTPHGTQWHEVKISFIDKDNVKISGRDKTEKRHYSEMGFKDNKSKRNESIFLWKFLKELASLSGKYTNCPDKEKDKVKKYFSDLRKALFQLFKIDGDPIPYKKTKDYTGYETAFIIEDKSFSKEHEDSIRKHYREYVPSKHKYICKDEDEGDEFTDNNYSLND